MAADERMENGVDGQGGNKVRVALQLLDDFFSMKELVIVVFLVSPAMIIGEGCIGYALVRERVALRVSGSVEDQECRNDKARKTVHGSDAIVEHLAPFYAF